MRSVTRPIKHTIEGNHMGAHSRGPIWERVDKPGVNIRYNAPQPTGVRWDSPLQDQAQTWLVGEEGEGDATYPVEWVLNPEEKPEEKPIRVRNPEAPPFGVWRQVDE
jgi:hypothetical protein